MEEIKELCLLLKLKNFSLQRVWQLEENEAEHSKFEDFSRV